MIEIHISLDVQSVLFGKYKTGIYIDYRFNNLVILTVKQFIFPVNINTTPFGAFM